MVDLGAVGGIAMVLATMAEGVAEMSFSDSDP